MLAGQYHFIPPVHEAVEHVFPPGVKKRETSIPLILTGKPLAKGDVPPGLGAISCCLPGLPYGLARRKETHFLSHQEYSAQRLCFINAPSFNICLAHIKTCVSGMGCHHVVSGSGDLRAEDPHFSLNFCPWLGWRIDSLPCCFLSFL